MQAGDFEQTSDGWLPRGVEVILTGMVATSRRATALPLAPTLACMARHAHCLVLLS